MEKVGIIIITKSSSAIEHVLNSVAGIMKNEKDIEITVSRKFLED